MAKAQILDVLADAAGKFGGGLGVFVDEGRDISVDDRKLLTRRLGFEEAIFINDVQGRKVSVYTSREEIPFAGQPMVGAAWMLSSLAGVPVGELHCLGGAVETWQTDGLTWIKARLDIMPPWHLREMGSPAEVEAVTDVEAAKLEHTLIWAWADEPNGQIRARTFASDWDIPEAQTNGSGSMVLAAKLKVEIEIKHGKGSIIYAKPLAGGQAAVGGRVSKRRDAEVSPR